MNIQNVIRLVEGHAEALARRWIERIRKEEGLEAYLSLPEAALMEHVTDAYREIGLFLDQPKHDIVRHHFHDSGRRRRKQSLPISDVIRAIQLARNVMWQYVLEQDVFDSSLNLYQAIDLYRQIVNFFDCAIVFAVEGYCEGS